MKNKLLTTVLILLAVLLLVACKPDTPPVEPDAPSTDDPTTVGEGSFPMSLPTSYTVVISEYAADEEKEAARIVRDAIEQAYGTRPQLGSDWIMGDVTDEEINASLEILIGDVDRAETKALKDGMELNGYMICVKGNKLIILGASYDMTLSAAEYFAEQVVGASTIELKPDYLYTLSYDPVLCETVYDTDDLVVADAVVIEYPYLADATGKEDATAAIQKALDDVYSRGGGTVYLPAGDYLVTNSINIPQGCLLKGDWQDPDTADKLEYGTVLLVRTPVLDEAYLADRTRDPLLCLNSNSSVDGLTFYYPDQDIHNVKKYGYTIYCQASTTMTISNVTLINSYRGIGLGVHHEEVSELAQISGAHITALETAYEQYSSSDVGYTTDVTVSPRYWAGAGRDFACADEAALRAYCKANTIGMQFNGLDDTHMSDLTLECLYTAIYMPDFHGFWGLLYNIDIKDSVNGIIIERLNGWASMAIAKASIEAEKAALYSSASSGSIRLCDVNAVSGDIVAVGNARIYEDSSIDLSEYDIVKATYEKPAQHLYVAPILTYSKTKQNVTPLIQKTLNEAAKTGGIVYIPAGVFSVFGTIEVPSGVELRGSTPFFMRDSASTADGIMGTVLLTYVKDGETVSLAEGAGVNGLRIFSAAISPKTAKKMVDENDPTVELQSAVKGHGANVYAHNVVIAGTFNGIDFTNCDNHSVKHAFGAVYRHFVMAGGKNGVIEQVLTNQTFYQRQQIIGTSLLDYKAGEQWGLATDQIMVFRDELRRAIGITVYLIDAENENVSNVFTYGPYSLVTTERSSATVLNVSSDFHGMGPMLDIKDNSDVIAVNVLRSAGESMRCDESSAFKLINRTAVSWFNEPDFDSTAGDEEPPSYEVSDKLMINDGSTAVDETEAYVGDEFSKTDGTSLYHAATDSQDMTVAIYDQTFPAIDISEYITDNGYLHMWVYVEDMTTSAWTGSISLLNGKGDTSISWSSLCFITHNGWNELWLPLTGTATLPSTKTVTRLRITDNRSELRIHSNFYFDDIYLCHADNDRVPVTMDTVPSYDIKPMPDRSVPSLPSGVMKNGDIVILTGDSLKDTAGKTNPARVMYEDEFVKEGSGSWYFRKMGSLTLNVPFQSSNITYFEKSGYLHLWLYVERASTLSGTIELSSSATDNVQELSWMVSEYVKKDGWNELYLPLSFPSSATTDMKWSAASYFRLQLKDSGVIVACIDDVRIVGEDRSPEELPERGSETFSFTVLKTEESAHVVYNYSDIHTNLTSRFMDNGKNIVYTYHVRDFSKLTAVKWSALVSGQLHLAVSTDNVNWVDVYRYFGMVTDSGLEAERRNFNLLDYIDNKDAEVGDIYVKVADSYTENGFGGCLHTAEPVEITFYYDEVDTSEWNCQDNGGVFKRPELDLPATEIHVFKPGSEQEIGYLKQNAAMLHGDLRYTDNNMHFVYGYPIGDYSKITELSWTAFTANELYLQISQDGMEWIDVYKAEERLVGALRTYDLLPLIDTESYGTMLYIRIRDSIPETGWGGAISCSSSVTFRVCYEGGEGQVVYPKVDKRPLPASETHIFIPGTSEESSYLKANSAMTNSSVRYADNKMIFTYAYSIFDFSKVSELVWSATTSNELRLQISQDGATWVDVYNTGDRLPAQERMYDLLSYIDRQSISDVLYIKISDSIPETGWGGAVSLHDPVTLCVVYEGGEGDVFYPQ